MTESHFEKTYQDMVRKGAMEKVRWLENLSKMILPSMRKRIQMNDKTVLQELVIPNWVKWELLHEWANEKATEGKGQLCVLCSGIKEAGIRYNNRFVCEPCFKSIKNL
ncbi:hypothetical protein KKE06_04335 [Candidatus Micrarchaeota archaeon]|nr:hypothetical protein [Candidatus Micrarchaeota archaeon]MBU1930329.1 hypothetical protein [Candidatus Micrarchaeota archaeon]